MHQGHPQRFVTLAQAAALLRLSRAAVLRLLPRGAFFNESAPDGSYQLRIDIHKLSDALEAAHAQRATVIR
jgi:hypothetical protein